MPSEALPPYSGTMWGRDMYAILEFENDIKSRVASVLDIDQNDIQLDIPGEDRGDYALPCFSFSKALKMNPPDAASYIASQLELEHGDVERTGPYLNFNIHEKYLAKNTIHGCLEKGDRYGELPAKKRKIIIEHTSANPNGPLHVGRARNPIIGDTISRIYSKAGYHVETQFYVDDIGRQVAILTWGTKNLQESELPEYGLDKIDHKLVRYYQKANQRMEEDGGVLEDIQGMMRDIEMGNKDILNEFSTNSERVMEGIRRSLERLNISHDVYKTESSLILDGSVSSVMQRMEELRICDRDEGALYFGEGDDRTFLTRGSGSSLYPLRDIAYHIWKSERCDEMLDVLGEDHKVHGAFLTSALSELGVKPVPRIIFHSFVSFQGERMSTRKGSYVTLDDIMNMAHEKAKEEVLARRDDLTMEDMERIAEIVGMGAVRYNIIRVQPEKPMDFKWEEALNLQGNSAPFVQYAHARASGIMERWDGDQKELLTKADTDKLTEEGEIKLIKKLAAYPREIRDAALSNAPHMMANYAYQLAARFNQFYRDYPVLKAEEKMMERLALVRSSKVVLSNVLWTMGITAPDSM